jgi:hypothetical protein
VSFSPKISAEAVKLAAAALADELLQDITGSTDVSSTNETPLP